MEDIDNAKPDAVSGVRFSKAHNNLVLVIVLMF